MLHELTNTFFQIIIAKHISCHNITEYKILYDKWNAAMVRVVSVGLGLVYAPFAKTKTF